MTFKKMLIASIVVVVVFGSAVAAAFIYFYRNPVHVLEQLTRRSLRSAGAERKTIATPDGTLTYFTLGSGSPVVLLHGANDQAGLWNRTARVLARDHRVIVPDLPGHGESAPATGPLSFAQILGGVRAVIEKECPTGKVGLVGNSLGGWIAMLWALEHPDRVSVVVLEDAGGVSIDYKGPSLLPKTREEARTVVKAVLGPSGPPMPGYILDDLVRRAPRSQVARMAGEDVRPYLLDDKLAGVNFPVALIWGEDDGVAPLDYGRHFASMIRGAQIVAIPNCGHIPHNQCPGQFNSRLVSALTELER